MTILLWENKTKQNNKKKQQRTECLLKKKTTHNISFTSLQTAEISNYFWNYSEKNKFNTSFLLWKYQWDNLYLALVQ